MTDSYNVGYSVDALGDLRKIWEHPKVCVNLQTDVR